MKTILVTGDVVVDHHIYEGQRFTASALDQRGVKVKRQRGGAQGLTNLINAVIDQTEVNWRKGKKKRNRSLQNAEENLRALTSSSKEATKIATAKQGVEDSKKKLEPPPETGWSAKFGLTLPRESAEPCGHHALAIWKPFPREPSEPNKGKVWRAELLMGYGHDDSHHADQDGKCPNYKPEVIKAAVSNPKLLVLDDGGFLFRHSLQKDCWFLPDETNDRPDRIILKMSGPVCRGDLWARLKKPDCKDRLIVVVSAQELRHECVRLSTGLSWERTVEELQHALHSSPFLEELATIPQHLLVTFSGDGALWLDNTADQPRATLIYDAAGAEGAWAPQFKGQAFGYLSCMVAALAYELMRDSTHPRLDVVARTGLAAMRDLHKMGHGPVADEKPPSGFPLKRLAKVIVRGSGEFSTTPVPWTQAQRARYAINPDDPGDQRPWRIVEMSQSPFDSDQLPSLLGLATQVVLQGESAIKRLPHARFGKLLTADRFEIEFLRSIERLMMNYHSDLDAKKPLCIGVFGPPGAGKSFGVRQLANSIFGEKAWQEFNLSQFKDVGDLIGAFHQVRDMVLSGLTPVIFWDEFDSREYYWLQYLLAPMQDGRFQEGQVNHALGKCVFIFAGATSFAFDEFGPRRLRTLKEGESYPEQETKSLPEIKRALDDFRLKKGRDFHSRLDGYFDVLGPNRRTRLADSGDPFDQRVIDNKDVCAPLRRGLLIRALLGVPTDARLDFDADLLSALLQSRNYRHGARSLEKLVQSLKPSTGRSSIRRSALPSPAQLEMHIDDVPNFNEILNKNTAFVQTQIIEPLADGIHETFRQGGWKIQPRFDRRYEGLEEVDKEENRAAARRIPEILALAGLKLEKKTDAAQKDDAGIEKHLEYHLERLAEAEHNGWMEHRIKNGWHYDENRDDLLKQHPALLRYADLSDIDQEKDKNSVTHFPKMVSLAGYRIMWA